MKPVMKLFSKMLLYIMAALFVFTSCELLFSDNQPDEKEEASFMILSDNASVTAEGGTIEVDLISSVPYEVKVMDEWLREVEVKTTNQYKHIFEIDPNTVAQERRAVISFCADGSCIPYTVTQAAADN
jgi:hypothetical protein